MQYFFSIDGANQKGPVERDQLRAAGVRADTMIWREGWSAWTPAGQVAELTDLFSDAASSVEVPAVPPAAVQAAYRPPSYGSSAGSPAGYQPAYATPEGLQTSPQTTSGMAIASLVLGIIGMIACCSYIPSILAIVFGHIARAEIRRTGRPGGGMATAGLVLGYIGLLLGVLLIVGNLFGTLAGMHTSSTNFGGVPTYNTPRVVPGR